MPKHAKLLLSKVINENDPKAFLRNGLTAKDMPTDTDKKAYEFIEQYAKENGGRSPSYALVADEIDGFDYIPDVTDSFDWLTKQVKGFAAKQEVMKLFETGEFERKLNELDGNEFVEKWLPETLDSVRMRTSVRQEVGTDIKSGGEKFWEEYQRRKAGESFRMWKSKYSSVGEYVSGNMYTLFGESGRGKSVFSLEDAIHAAKQGANVLIWAMEMSSYEIFVRIYTSLSGDARVAKTWYDGQMMDAGFNARDMRTGQLEESFEEAFRVFLENITEYISGNITVRAVDDEDFVDRSLRALESDIDKTEADFVMIDPFYYMSYEQNVNKTTGGAAAETSMKLRALAGRTNVVVLALTQSETKKTEKTEEGVRELALPDRDEVRKTQNLLDDATTLIGIDSDYQQGLGIVGIAKGRNGGENSISNCLYLPQIGKIEEIETGEDAIASFDF